MIVASVGAETNAPVTNLNLPGIQPPTANTEISYLRLKLSKDKTNTEDVIIQFKPTAAANYVFNEDAPYFKGFGSVNLSSFSSDGIALAINVLPLPEKKPDIIKLNVWAKSSGVLKLAMNEIKNVPQLYDVWLMDKYAKDSLDMRHNSSYSLSLDTKDTASFGANRFALVIRQNPAFAYRLLNFTASKLPDAKRVELQWDVENEGDQTYFTVERSINNGKAYKTIDSLKATGIGIYSLVDACPSPGQNIYHLKQEDVNSNVTYSNDVGVLFAVPGSSLSDGNLNIYPNPVNSTINLTVTTPPAENTSYNIKLMDGSGKLITEATSEQPAWQSSVSNLQPGTYFIQVFDNKTQGLIGKTKFVKF